MGNLHEKFKGKLAELKAKIASGDFDASVETIDLGIGMSDSELTKEAARRHRPKRNDSGPIPPLSSTEVAEYEAQQLGEYEAAVEAAELGAQNVKLRGWGAKDSQAAQYQREQKVRDMQSPAEVIRDEYELLDDVPGTKELEALLNEHGFGISVERKGKVWVFTAVKAEKAEAPLAAPVVVKESYTPDEVQEEIQRALEDREAAKRAEADAEELVKLRAQAAELAKLKEDLPGVIEKAVAKAVDQVRREEQRVHDVLIALYGKTMPAELVEKLKSVHVNGDAS
jgi:hypothetical protein